MIYNSNFDLISDDNASLLTVKNIVWRRTNGSEQYQ